MKKSTIGLSVVLLILIIAVGGALSFFKKNIWLSHVDTKDSNLPVSEIKTFPKGEFNGRVLSVTLNNGSLKGGELQMEIMGADGKLKNMNVMLSPFLKFEGVTEKEVSAGVFLDLPGASKLDGEFLLAETLKKI